MKIKLDEYNFIISATTDDNTFGENDIIINEDINTQLYYGGVPVYKYQNGQMTMVTNEQDYINTSWWDTYIKSTDEFYTENGRLPIYGISLDLVKEYKIKEMDAACTQDVYNGFPSKVFDGVTEKIYDFYEFEQSNLIGMMCFINASVPIPIYWKAKGELVAYEWTANQIMGLCQDAYNVKLMKVLKYQTLRYQVLSCTTRSEVEAIFYTP